MSNSSAAIKLAKQRLSALQLAEALGNVSEACRRRGISRTQFYEYISRPVRLYTVFLKRCGWDFCQFFNA